MKRSSQRILTTHVGSLIRPEPLLDCMRAKIAGKPLFRMLAERQGREANPKRAQSWEMWSFWIMTIGMGVMVLALTGAGILQVWLQRLPTEGAMSFMATQDQLRFFYWVRLAGGVMFLGGLLVYLRSFFIGPAADEQLQPGNGRLRTA